MAFGQTGISLYPGGHLLMEYRITSDQKAFTYAIELIPQGDGTYKRLVDRPVYDDLHDVRPCG